MKKLVIFTSLQDDGGKFANFFCAHGDNLTQKKRVFVRTPKDNRNSIWSGSKPNSCDLLVVWEPHPAPGPDDGGCEVALNAYKTVLTSITQDCLTGINGVEELYIMFHNNSAGLHGVQKEFVGSLVSAVVQHENNYSHDSDYKLYRYVAAVFDAAIDNKQVDYQGFHNELFSELSYPEQLEKIRDINTQLFNSISKNGNEREAILDGLLDKYGAFADAVNNRNSGLEAKTESAKSMLADLKNADDHGKRREFDELQNEIMQEIRQGKPALRRQLTDYRHLFSPNIIPSLKTRRDNLASDDLGEATYTSLAQSSEDYLSQKIETIIDLLRDHRKLLTEYQLMKKLDKVKKLLEKSDKQWRELLTMVQKPWSEEVVKSALTQMDLVIETLESMYSITDDILIELQ